LNPLEAQAALAFLLLKYRLSVTVTLGPRSSAMVNAEGAETEADVYDTGMDDDSGMVDDDPTNGGTLPEGSIHISVLWRAEHGVSWRLGGSGPVRNSDRAVLRSKGAACNGFACHVGGRAQPCGETPDALGLAALRMHFRRS
jgi:hypothetical protein